MIATVPQLICYPPAPINGGPLETAPTKVGEWVWQPKIDGRRVVIHAPSSTIWNQYGQLSVAMIDFDKFKVALEHIRSTASRFEHFGGTLWLDCELMEYRHDLMRGCLVVLDLIDGSLPFMRRRAMLRSMFPVLPFFLSQLLRTTGGQVRDSVYLISQWDNGREPLKLYDWLKQENELIGHKFYEGLVAKRVNALYPFFQRAKTTTPDWIKHRFDQ